MTPRHYALGRFKAGTRNKTEAAYERDLELLKHAGVVLWYRFEGITFKVAHDTRYTPDFLVMKADRTLECHEVKGHWTDDAKVKVKVASEAFPMFRFVVVKADKSGWQLEEVP